MTVAEMITGVNLGVQKVNSNAFDTLLNEEIVYYLKKAEAEFIRDQYVLLRGKYTDQGSPKLYKKAQEAYENLRTLIQTSVFGSANVSSVSHISNAHKVAFSDLSETFKYYVRSQTQIESGGDWVENDLISHHDIQDYIYTRYNKPTFRSYKVFLEGSEMFILYDIQGANVYDVALTFVREPDTLVETSPGTGETTTSELPTHTHDEVVNLAVDMILQDIKSQRPVKPPQVDEEVD